MLYLNSLLFFHYNYQKIISFFVRYNNNSSNMLHDIENVYICNAYKRLFHQWLTASRLYIYTLSLNRYEMA